MKVCWNSLSRLSCLTFFKATTLQKLREEQDRLAIVVKEQNLSPEEVSRMNSEHDNLARTLEELRRKSAESSNHARSLEVALAKRSENVEQAVDDYTDYLDRLGLFPCAPPPLPNTDLRLEVNFASSNPKELIRRGVDGSGADLKNDIKATLDVIADHLRQELHDLENEVITVEQDLDNVAVQADAIEEAIFETERRTGTVQDEAEAIRIVRSLLI